jgi:uncharacterized protein YndB with AHSA1/START domain
LGENRDSDPLPGTTHRPYRGFVSKTPYVIDYKAAFDFAAPPPVVWQTIEHSERFENWWGWLKEFRLEGGGLRDGSVLHGVVEPPVPYRMRLRVELESCSAPRRIDAAVHGDLEGTARLLLEPNDRGTRAMISWSIEMMQRPMRVACRVARPLLTWGHDRVVEATVSSFRRHVESDLRAQVSGTHTERSTPAWSPRQDDDSLDPR